MDFADNLQNQVLGKRTHSGPVLDIGSEVDVYGRIRYTLGVKYAVCVNLAVKVILIMVEITVKFGSRCQYALVCCGCGYGSCIHKSNGSNLTALQLGTFTVREVSGRMTDTEGVVGGCIACAEAGTAECCLHNRTGFQNSCCTTVPDKFHVYRHGSGIYA